MPLLSELRSDVEQVDASERKVREFGLLVGAVLVVVSVWFRFGFWEVFLTLGLVLLVLELARPAWLRYPYLVWMTAAIILGFFIFRLLLTLIFFAVITPVAAVARLAGYDPLRLRSTGEPSYWVPHQQSGTMEERFERLF